MIPEIDIWRVANLMLRRYGDEADIESALRAEELFEEGDHNGAAVWRRVIVHILYAGEGRRNAVDGQGVLAGRPSKACDAVGA